MVTGAVPFAGETPLAVAYQHVNAAVPVPSSIRPGTSPALDDLVARATARDPDDRYPDAAAFLADVRDGARRRCPRLVPFGVTEDQAATLVVPLADGRRRSRAGRDRRRRRASPSEQRRSPGRRRRRGWIPVLALLIAGALVAGAGVVPRRRTARSRCRPWSASRSRRPRRSSPRSGSRSTPTTTGFSETVPPARSSRPTRRPAPRCARAARSAPSCRKGPERYAVPAGRRHDRRARPPPRSPTAPLTVGEQTPRPRRQGRQVGLVIRTDTRGRSRSSSATRPSPSSSPRARRRSSSPTSSASPQAAATAALTKLGLEVELDRGVQQEGGHRRASSR